MQEAIGKITYYATSRPGLPINILMPEMLRYFVHAEDKRYKRNVVTVRNMLQTIMDDRRKGSTESLSGEADLLAICLSSESFKDNDEDIKDNIFGFFLAGMKTIQISTTNMIYHMTKRPDLEKKLLAEILPPLEKVKNNLVEGFTLDIAQDFEFLQHCWYESMRMEPPANMVNAQVPI